VSVVGERLGPGVSSEVEFGPGVLSPVGLNWGTELLPGMAAGGDGSRDIAGEGVEASEEFD